MFNKYYQIVGRVNAPNAHCSGNGKGGQFILWKTRESRGAIIAFSSQENRVLEGSTLYSRWSDTKKKRQCAGFLRSGKVSGNKFYKGFLLLKIEMTSIKKDQGN